jgi:hypothetical protein
MARPASIAAHVSSGLDGLATRVRPSSPAAERVDVFDDLTCGVLG